MSLNPPPTPRTQVLSLQVVALQELLYLDGVLFESKHLTVPTSHPMSSHSPTLLCSRSTLPTPHKTLRSVAVPSRTKFFHSCSTHASAIRWMPKFLPGFSVLHPQKAESSIAQVISLGLKSSLDFLDTPSEIFQRPGCRLFLSLEIKKNTL